MYLVDIFSYTEEWNVFFQKGDITGDNHIKLDVKEGFLPFMDELFLYLWRDGRGEAVWRIKGLGRGEKEW